jgi:hypothetical protein
MIFFFMMNKMLQLGVLARSFREFSTLQADVIRYDDFLRICLVAKAVSSKAV